MEVTINKANFLIDLFDKYRESLYISMRCDHYEMSDILNFINGYTLVFEYCSSYVVDSIMAKGYNPISNFNIVLFNTYEEMIKALEKVTVNNNAIKALINYDKWEIIGIKYAICLAKLYIKNIFSDNYFPYEHYYLHIPDKNNPEDYNWEEYGWDYDLFN